MKTACFYHANCFDGICAAWVVKRYHPECELVAAQYGTDFPFNEYGKKDNIIIVDFSYPRDTMIAIQNAVGDIVVLDHHKTAEENCKGLDFCIFDMKESGASLAWKYFYPKEPMPALVRYIKDRDLWLFEEASSEEINAFIQSYPQTIEAYEELYKQLEKFDGQIHAKVGGEAIVRYKNQLVQQIIKNRIMVKVGGYEVPTVNCPILMSEVGHALAELNEGPFGAYYFDRKDGKTQWGARSIGDFDVSVVAKSFGGGGHKNAAGWEE